MRYSWSGNFPADVVFEDIKGIGGRAACFTGPGKGELQAVAVFAHPADLTCRHANHQRVGRHVAVDDGAGADEGILSHNAAADDGAIGAQSRTALDQGVAIFVLARDGAARVIDVGEDHARAAENVVFQRDVVVHRDVVLHLDVVADDDLVADEHVLAKGAITADDCLAADMNPMPNAGVLADLGAFIDDGRRVYRVVTH